MKKFLIFLCCLVSLAALAGCSNDSDNAKTNTNVKVDAGNIDDNVKVDVGNFKTDVDVKTD